MTFSKCNVFKQVWATPFWLLIVLPALVLSQSTAPFPAEVFPVCTPPNNNGTEDVAVREYIVGGNTWHIPVLDYLTQVMGKDFDPPIAFVRETPNLFLNAASPEVARELPLDFVIANPHRASCFATEVGTIPLATQLFNQPQLDGIYKNFSQYGATLYALKNRTDLRTILDIKDKKIGTNKITNLATHLCYDVLLRNGIHHLQDPKQTIFFSNSVRALEALLDGRVDVGCAATGILETNVDLLTNGTLNLDNFRILNSQTLDSDGRAFPYAVSSQLVPGYEVAAYPHVEGTVINRLQRELLAMRDHADVAPALLACLEQMSCTVEFNNTSFQALDGVECVETCFDALPQPKHCDTSPRNALQAFAALRASNLIGFQEPLQNLKMRDIQERTGFLKKTLAAPPTCVRMKNLADAVTCPPGHFVRSSGAIVKQCNVSTLECYGQDCICKPCIKAFEVDFFPVLGHSGSMLNNTTTENEIGTGCSKFSLCGTVQQEHVLSFRAIDNRARPNTMMSGGLLLPDESEEMFVFNKVEGTNVSTFFEFDFHATSMRVGQKTIKIYIDEVEIPESPFRISVVKRDCPAETGDESREADAYGDCVCQRGTVDMSGRCMHVALPIVSSILIFLLLVCICIHFYLKHKREQADNIWKVKPNELHFDEPPRVLGRGTFGLVILAQYRGTLVAVKGILPPKEKDSHQDSTLRHGNRDQRLRGYTRRISRVRETFVEATSPISKRGWFCNQTKSTIRASFVEEIRLLARLRHPCIATVMGAIVSTKWEPMLVMEYMHFGSLHDLLHNQSVFLDDQTLIEMLHDVASGLRFLHSSDPAVIHGDLKSRNILVDDKFRAKVSDFGCSRHDHGSRGSPNRPRGTPFWMAPELLRGKTSNSTESDVYSFGIILYEAYARKEPYEDEDYEEVMDQILNEGVRKLPPQPENCPSEIATIMSACLNCEPTERPEATGLAIRLSWMLNEQKKKVDASSLGESSLELNYPNHVLKALQEGEGVGPQMHEKVTIVFVTIAGYNEITHAISTTKLTLLLEELRSSFESICEHLGVFQVQTTNEAYMFVTNLVLTQSHHSSLAAKFAVEASSLASAIPIDDDDTSAGYLNLRIGIHTGPVATHVRGTKHPRLTLIGDTVNTAAHLERTSLPGRIHCSEDSYRLLAQEWGYNEFLIEQRRLFEVNGAEDMTTYWIEGDPEKVPEKVRRC